MRLKRQAAESERFEYERWRQGGATGRVTCTRGECVCKCIARFSRSERNLGDEKHKRKGRRRCATRRSVGVVRRAAPPGGDRANYTPRSQSLEGRRPATPSRGRDATRKRLYPIPKRQQFSLHSFTFIAATRRKFKKQKISSTYTLPWFRLLSGQIITIWKWSKRIADYRLSLVALPTRCL